MGLSHPPLDSILSQILKPAQPGERLGAKNEVGSLDMAVSKRWTLKMTYVSAGSMRSKLWSIIVAKLCML